MKRLALAVSALVLSSVAASAADMAPRYTKAPPPIVAAVYDWSGFYIGLNGGGGWSRKCWDVTNILGVPIVPNLAEGCHDATGGVVGGQIGYRWQMASWVFGLEGQGDWANLSGSNASLLLAGLVTNRSKINAIGLITGQVGYAMNNVLFYFKGGVMGVSDKYDGFITAINFPLDRASQTRYGGAAGVGIDFGITPNLILGVDYMHGFMGTSGVNFTSVALPGVFSRNERIRQDIDMVTARFSYKFGGGAVVARY